MSDAPKRLKLNDSQRKSLDAKIEKYEAELAGLHVAVDLIQERIVARKGHLSDLIKVRERDDETKGN